MIMIYILFCLFVLFPLSLWLCHMHDGHVDVGALAMCFTTAFIPFVNIGVIVVMIVEVTRANGFWYRKLF